MMMRYQSDFKRKKKKEATSTVQWPRKELYACKEAQGHFSLLKGLKTMEKKIPQPWTTAVLKAVTQSLSSQRKNVKDISKLIGQTIDSDYLFRCLLPLKDFCVDITEPVSSWRYLNSAQMCGKSYLFLIFNEFRANSFEPSTMLGLLL